jgi:hypothetical protein
MLEYHLYEIRGDDVIGLYELSAGCDEAAVAEVLRWHDAICADLWEGGQLIARIAGGGVEWAEGATAFAAVQRR